MTDTEKKLEETDKAIKGLIIKLSGITMINIILEELKDYPVASKLIRNNLLQIQDKFERRMKNE